MKRQVTDWEKIFAKHKSNQGLISKTYKELLKLNNKKTDNPILKRAKDLKRHLAKEDIQRATEHMKRCSIAIDMSLRKGKLKQRYHYTPLDDTSPTLSPPKAGEDSDQQELSPSSLMGMQNGTATLEDSLVVSYKTKHPLTIWSSNPIPWVNLLYPNELKAYVHAKTCTQMFIAALFIIAKTWK